MNCEKLKTYEYISFDLYDTLIKRNILKPTDIYTIVEKKYNNSSENKINNFKNIRILCEKKCRDGVKGEISLDMIYEKINNYFNNSITAELRKIEEEAEIAFTQKNLNEYIQKLYNYAVENKKVIITTDMYLPESIIKKILLKCGIKYDKLYLSSTSGKRKSNSEMFKYILKDLNISPSKIVHVGDNKHSDYDMARSVGIDSILIPNFVINAPHLNAATLKKVKNNINYNVIESFINNNVEGLNYFETFGYECFGPILLFYSKWIYNEVKKQGINNVYFLARDGKIMKKAFDIINDDEKIKSYYFMASRRSIIVPSLWKCSDIYEVFSKMNIPSKIVMSDLLKRLGLDDYNLNELLEKHKISYDKKYLFETLKKEYSSFFNEIYPLVIENSKHEYEALKKYLKYMEFENKVAIADIGWYGNMQQSLVNITNDTIYGYYFGLRPAKKSDIITKGFLFDKDFNEEYNLREYYFTSIFEFIFSASHGSVKKFNFTDEHCELYPSENSESYELNSLNDLQNGAIKFVTDYYNSKLMDYAYLNEKESCNNIFEVLFNPTKEDAEKIGNLKFKDGEINYIAKSDRLNEYFFNIKKLKNDFKKSSWKIGFMKNLFKLNLPYGYIYKLIKKIK